ncbi:MAG: cation-translocating P-type ATPase [Bacilli bacterium]|nr:cation-translocating P-type ATPase [Bacilli bacterium]
MYECKSKNETLESLGVDAQKGLSAEEAKARLAQNGPNKLAEKPKDPWIKVFWGNIKDPMTGILAVAALISLVLSIIDIVKTGNAEGLADVFIIFGVVLLNATIGTIQEMKAEAALDALRDLSSPTATVRRDGAILEIKAEELVLGDIVILEEGRSVPADLRLLESHSLKTEEASLTGESLPVEKDAELVFSGETPVAERLNIVYMSTPVVYGRGVGVVVGTGMGTEIGKIASMLSADEDNMTPLQRSLAKLSKFLGWLTVGIVLLMLVVKIVWALVNGNLATEWSQALLDSVALAVAAIPEGLTAVVTIVLALGVGRMVKVNTIVRRLASVETLGAVSVICSDKTGTLTMNQMTVVACNLNGKHYGKEQIADPALMPLARGMALCCDAKTEGGVYGDPTEIALIRFAESLGKKKSELEAENPRVDELPFDSVRKMMSTRHKADGKDIVYTKGGLDVILRHCVAFEENGKVIPITEEKKKEIVEASGLMTADALRVLALAYSYPKGKGIVEDGLVYLGMVGMVDPPREEAKPAVATLKKAGIITVMITGDHRDTAFAIAKELGIASEVTQCMTGEDIDHCSEEELIEKTKTVRVYSRVSPENKVSIVKAFKANGSIVAMTGDGVNDAPSLKSADIGIAMGKVGTDVAKGAADMVLTDDNFASIEKAVEEGRGIYANIKKTILFLLSSNIGEVVCMLVASALGLPSPLIAIHLLWVNLITDSLPAVALGADKKPDDIMSEKPRDPKEGLFAHGGVWITFGYGILIGLVTLAAFLVNPLQHCIAEGLPFTIPNINAYFNDPAMGETHLKMAQAMAFCVLSFSELFHMLGMVDMKKSFVMVLKHKNLLLYLSFFIGMGLQLFVIECPGVNEIFKVAVAHEGTVHALSSEPIDYAWVFGLALVPLLVHEIVALVLFIRDKVKGKRG